MEKQTHDESSAMHRAENYTKKWFRGALLLLQKNAISPNSTVDVGAGKGEFLEIIKKNFSNSTIHAIDYSQQNITVLNEKKIPNTLLDLEIASTKNVSEIHALRFAFDTVISLETIEHIFNTNGYFDLIHLLLKPNGYFVCSTPNTNSFPYLLHYLMTGIPLGEGHHVRFFSFDRLYTFAFFHGFDFIDQQNFFTNGAHAIKKSFHIKNSWVAGGVSLLFFIPAWIIEVLRIRPYFTKDQLVVLFKKSNRKPLPVDVQCFDEAWNALSKDEQTIWKNACGTKLVWNRVKTTPLFYAKVQTTLNTKD